MMEKRTLWFLLAVLGTVVIVAAMITDAAISKTRSRRLMWEDCISQHPPDACAKALENIDAERD